jgi:GNAT superfamily N-acetyltransferase
MVNVRPLQPCDIDALYAIALATASAGGDASSLYRDPKLIGQIYSAPYAWLQPERRLERQWWPELRRQYLAPDEKHMAEWSHDQQRAFMIHNPTPAPAAVAQSYPAHLHMNLLPRLQGRGIGSRLFAAWLAVAAPRGVGAMHVGANRHNTRAFNFWQRVGFVELDIPEARAGRTTWMGRE